MTDPYRYETSVKSDYSDELINTVLLRPIAGILVGVLFRTPVTPNQVTVASIGTGLLAAFLYAGGGSGNIALAGILVTIKDILDSADGQLARAKGMYSRRGRFLDSIGDVLVNGAVFAGIGWTLTQSTGDPTLWFWCALAFAGITLRVSYHVFYQTAYLHLSGSYQANRLTEDVTDDDRKGDQVALVLQRVFQHLYGWQDRLIARIDAWCGRDGTETRIQQGWYDDKVALRLSGLVGLGTELFLLMLCSIFNQLETYLIINIILMNAVVVAGIGYRRLILRKRLREISQL